MSSWPRSPPFHERKHSTRTRLKPTKDGNRQDLREPTIFGLGSPRYLSLSKPCVDGLGQPHRSHFAFYSS